MGISKLYTLMIVALAMLVSMSNAEAIVYKVVALGAYGVHDQIVLTIKTTSDSTFTGTFKDGSQVDDVYGWFVREKGPYYSTKHIYFYRYIKVGREHIQFFNGKYSHDEQRIAGTFFYYGATFGWYAKRE